MRLLVNTQAISVTFLDVIPREKNGNKLREGILKTSRSSVK